jgi:AcrR family transcriptional regulator
VTKREIRKKQITEKRQEQILKAAMTVFSQKGYAAATIPEIAGLAGVAAGTIYLYYPSKRELFVSVITKTIITVPLLNLLGQIQKADFPTVFKRIIQNRLSFAEGDKMVQISSLMSEIQRDPELRGLFVSKMFRPIMDMMEGFYRMGMVEGQLNQYEPKVVVRAIGGMIIGLLILKSVEGEEGPLSQLSRDEVSDDVVRLVLYGLMAGEDQKRVLNKRRRHEE